MKKYYQLTKVVYDYDNRAISHVIIEDDNMELAQMQPSSPHHSVTSLGTTQDPELHSYVAHRISKECCVHGNVKCVTSMETCLCCEETS